MKEYDVVISGMSGSFAGKLHLQDLKEQIYAEETELITLDSKGFHERGEFDIPEYIGEISDAFDGYNFGIHGQLIAALDSNLKVLLEKCYEAINDAGIYPLSLAQQRVAVVTSISSSDSDMECWDQGRSKYSVLLLNKGMLANRVSYYFNFVGPSFMTDSSWTGGLNALDIAARFIQKGAATAALVASSNVIKLPHCAYHLGENSIPLLSSDGKTRSFSEKADGFTRSEGVVVLFLQRQEDALRSYGKIEKTSATSILQSEQNILFCDCKSFLKDFYDDVNFDCEDIAYIEADGLAIPERDRLELEGLLEAVCRRRSAPLPVTCCKSRLGHAGSVSGLVSLAHALLACQASLIPPTLHYQAPASPTHPANNSAIQIVTEATPMKGNLVAVSSFGHSGIGAHVVIRQNPKTRQPEDILNADDPPALLLISGRDDEKLQLKLTKLSTECKDKGFVALVHKAYKQTNHTNLQRGFVIANSPVPTVPVIETCDIKEVPSVWFMFTGMGSQWSSMGKDLLQLPLLAQSLHRSHQVLLSKGQDLLSIITSDDPHIYDNITNSFLGITAIQIALVDLLNCLEIKPAGLIGHSLGEIACGYADGCLTAEQAILCAEARGRASNEAKLIKGMMAAIGKGYEEIKDSLPDGVDVACHNSSTSCTISGPVNLVEDFVEQLKSRDVFAKTVNVSDIAYHSRYIAPAGPLLLKYTQQVIREPVERSSKWVCTSRDESRWEEAKMCSAEYYTNNLLSPVLFDEASKHIPDEALVIEVAPHGLLQAIVKRSLSNCAHVPLTSRLAKNNLVFLLEAVGRLYTKGLDLDISSIYPAVTFPVPRETNFVCSLLSWNYHSKTFNLDRNGRMAPSVSTEVSLDADSGSIVIRDNYIIGGMSVVPLARILENISQFVTKRTKMEDGHFLRIEEVTVLSYMEIPSRGNTKFTISVLESGSMFVVDSYSNTIITGICKEDYYCKVPNIVKESREELDNLTLIDHDQIYAHLDSFSYSFNKPFKNLKQIHLSCKGYVAEIDVEGGMTHLIDSMLMSLIFYNSFFSGRPCFIETIRSAFIKNVVPNPSEGPVLVYYSASTGTLSCDSVFISSVKLVDSNPLHRLPTVTSTLFLPVTPRENIELEDFYHISAQVMLQETHSDIGRFILLGERDIPINPLNILRIMKDLGPNIMMEYKSLYEVSKLSELSQEARKECSYVLVSSGQTTPEQIINFCCSNENNFVILLLDNSLNNQAINSWCSGFQSKLVSLFGCVMDNCRAFVFKMKPKRNDSVNVANIVSVKEDNWECKVKSVKESMMKSPASVWWILSSLSLYSRLTAAVKQTSSDHSTKLKFLFVDKESPRYDVSAVMYKSQLERGLRMNVYQEGVWGRLVQLPLSASLVLTNIHDVIITTFRSQNLTIESVAISQDECDSFSEVVDYAGRVGERRVMGVGRTSRESVEVDAHLRWECPAGWSPHEAATVPTTYSLAYYAVLLRVPMKRCDKVLIVGGDTPIGEAALRVVLATATQQLCVTCSSQAHREAIIANYPQLPASNILLYEKNRVLADINYQTSIVGFDVIINCHSEEDSLRASLEYVSELGSIYFQMSKEPVKNNAECGLSAFGNGLSMISCWGEILLGLTAEDKEQVRRCVQEGIESGVVKPLTSRVITAPLTRQQLRHTFQACRTANETPVVSLLKGEQLAKDNKDRKPSCLVIGQADLTFHLLLWLTSKEDTTFHFVFDDKNASPFLFKRMNLIFESMEGLDVQFHSAKAISSSHSLQSLIKKIQSQYSIKSAFVITEGLGEGVCAGLSALHKETEVCLVGEAGQPSCNLLLSSGHPCLCLVPEPGLCLIDLLTAVSLLRSSRSLGLYHITFPPSLITAKNLSCKDLLPRGWSELLDLGHSLTEKVAFREVPTKSSPFHTPRDSMPVFLLPGFRVSKLTKLSQRLFYPAFLASMPASLPDHQTLATQFVQCLEEQFNQKLYTFVCEGWTTILTVKIAEMLEERGKACQLFLLDPSVDLIKNSLKDISMLKLISRFFSLSPKNYQEVSHISCPNKQIDLALAKSSLKHEDKPMLKRCLKNMLQAAKLSSKVDLSSVQLNIFITSFRSSLYRGCDQATDIQKLTKHAVFVLCLDDEDVLSSEHLAGFISDTCFLTLPGLYHKQNLLVQQRLIYFNETVSKIKDVKLLL